MALLHRQQLKSSTWISWFEIWTVKISHCECKMMSYVQHFSPAPHERKEARIPFCSPHVVFFVLLPLLGLLPSRQQFLQLLLMLQDINRCQNTMFFLVAPCEPRAVCLLWHHLTFETIQILQQPLITASLSLLSHHVTQIAVCRWGFSVERLPCDFFSALCCLSKSILQSLMRQNFESLDFFAEISTNSSGNRICCCLRAHSL